MVTSTRARRGRGRLQGRAVTIGVLGLAVIVLGVFLASQGLDEADKWASVLGLFLNVVGALGAVAALWLGWQNRPRREPGVADELETEPLRQSDPHRVGGFRLFGRLGYGATGVVYLGRAVSGLFAAVKVVRSDLADDPVFRQRFEHEVRCIERLGGGRFPTMLAASVTAERPWLATAYEPGMPLDDAVAEGGAWSLPAVAWLAGGLAAALREIHAQDIVHRDLTPSNILVSDTGPLIVDFGIARAASDTRLTRTGAPMGTIAFMSPEQANGDEEVGPAADVFALGSLLAFTANGRPPFGERPADTVLSRIRLHEPDLGALVRSDHPVVAVIASCLTKDPARRPSPDELVAACEEYARQPADALLPDVVRSRIARQRAVTGSGLGVGTGSRTVAATGVWGLLGDGLSRLRRPRPAVGSSRPIATRAQVAVAIGVAVVVGAVSWIVWWPWSSALATCDGTADTTLRMASSADKSVLLNELATEYGQRRADGHCVRVLVDEVNSGTGMAALARGWKEPDGPRPDLWSPASREWLYLARQQAASIGASGAVAALPTTEPEPIVTTPLVIAMPRPMAEKLGWPDNRDIGWRQLAELATDDQGWGRYGMPEWGRFRLGKTNPKYSTSGLNATIGVIEASRQRGDGPPDQPDKIDGGDVRSDAARRLVQDIEQSIAHYGETSLHFLANMRHAADEGRALSYVSAVTVEESSMLAYNVGYPRGTSNDERISEPSTKLAAIYPAEGTIYSDHPYIELAWPDTSQAQREVAADFLGYLHSAPVQSRFQQYGFRDYRGRPGPLSTLDNGALPDARITELPLPDAPVIQDVLTTWTSLRKPANVLLVMDVSASMADGLTAKIPADQECPDEEKVTTEHEPLRCPNKLERVKQARVEISNGFNAKDQVGLWEFSEDLDGPVDHRELVPVAPFSESQKELLQNAIAGLQPRTNTGLYNSISAAVDTMRANLEPDTINAVVVLTDGSDTGAGIRLDALLEKLRGTDSEPVRVFTIAYGFGSDEDRNGQLVLQQIADASGAAKYEAEGSQRIIEQLVAAVVSNF